MTKPKEPASPAPPTPPAGPSPEPAPGAPRRPRWKARLLVAACVLVAATVGAEALLRKLAPREPAIWVEHPLCYLVQNPNLAVKVRGWNGATFTYATNALGFRGKSIVAPVRTKDTYRIFFLGDELFEGADLPEEQTVSGLTESLLEARRTPDDVKVEVANAAGPTFGSEAILATLLHRVLACDPDLVVVQTAQNDVRLSLAEDWDETGLFWRASSFEAPTFGETLRSVSRLADVLHGRAVLFGMARPDSASPRPFARLRPQQQAIDWKKTLPTYRRAIHQVAAACRDAKCDLVVCTQPTLLKERMSPEELKVLEPIRVGSGPEWPRDEMRRTLESYDDELRTAAAREGVHLVELATRVPRDLEHFSGAFHLTPRGHDVVARAIVDVAFPDGRPARRASSK